MAIKQPHETSYSYRQHTNKYTIIFNVTVMINIKFKTKLYFTDLPNRQDAVSGNSFPSAPFLFITTILPNRGIVLTSAVLT